MVIGGGGHQGLVGHAEHLPLGRQILQQLGHRSADAATDARIDLIEQQGHMRIRSRQTGFQRQQKARHLPAGGHLRQGRQGLTGVRREQKLHRIGPLLRGAGGLELHGKAHVGEPHRPQPGQQLLLQGRRRRLTGLGEGAIGPVTGGTAGAFRPLKRLQAGLGAAGGQLLPQGIPPADQLHQILAMAALQGLELGDALLQLPQALRITLQGGAITIQLPGQVLELGQAVAAALQQRRQRRIQLLHGGQLPLTGSHMIQRRRRLLGPLHQPPDQRHDPLLQAHPMGEAVFLRLQPLPLIRVLQLGRLQIGQHLLLALPFLLQLLPIGLGLLQGQGRTAPGPMGFRHRRQQGLERLPGETVQPATLLAGARQLLGLALHGEVQQQGAQLLDLGAVHRHPIEPVAAAEPIVAESPLAAQQDLPLLGLQLLLLKPGRQRRREVEAGLDGPALRPLAQQPRARAPQQRIERIQQDRLARAGFTSEHRETTAEFQLQPLDQSDVFEAQSSEHRRSGAAGSRRVLGPTVAAASFV